LEGFPFSVTYSLRSETGNSSGKIKFDLFTINLSAGPYFRIVIAEVRGTTPAGFLFSGIVI
jgi:hypothetical protein